MEFILASNNQKKLAEMQRILSPLGIEVKTAAMLGLELPAIADDSGLCVDYLDGAPGIYSARFSGGHGNDEANNDLLLQKLEGVPMEQRTAYYVCAICCVFPDGEELTVRGECHGHIGFERDGNAGFGYDPLFLVEGRSFGRYTAEEKDKISHRGRALRTLAAELEKRI